MGVFGNFICRTTASRTGRNRHGGGPPGLAPAGAGRFCHGRVWQLSEPYRQL